MSGKAKIDSSVTIIPESISLGDIQVSELNPRHDDAGDVSTLVDDLKASAPDYSGVFRGLKIVIKHACGTLNYEGVIRGFKVALNHAGSDEELAEQIRSAIIEWRNARPPRTRRLPKPRMRLK